MREQTHLVKRGSRWYYRQRVPSDLVEYLGKPEIMVSLKTCDRDEAKTLAKLKAVEIDRQFQAARRAGDAVETPDVPDA